MLRTTGACDIRRSAGEKAGKEFCLDAQAVLASRVLLLQSLKAGLLRIAQPSNVLFRKRVRAQQLSLFAFPKLTLPEIVRARAQSDQRQLEVLPAALL